MIHRHDAVVQTLATYVRSVGGLARVEPRDPDTMTKERPDIDVFLCSSHIQVDVMITHPTAKYNLRCATRTLGAASKAEKLKIAKHGSKAKGATIFLPYVVETFGGLAKQAQEFHKLIANYGEQFSSAHSRRNLLSSISSDIARIVKEGNLRVVEKGLQQVSYNHHSNNTTIANDMYISSICLLQTNT